jgi:DNA-binding PadR family transcriptional regulator
MPLTDLQRAALQMLAKSPRGYALSTAMARGFSFEMLQRLVRVGYATSHRDMVGTRKEKLPHLRITEAGRKAIGGFL